MVSSTGGAPGLGGDPVTTVLGLIVLLIVVGFVVWKMT
jgi:hypothetical protein